MMSNNHTAEGKRIVRKFDEMQIRMVKYTKQPEEIYVMMPHRLWEYACKLIHDAYDPLSPTNDE